jgi:lactam utilization protein B
MSKASALRAAAEDVGAVESVVRQLVNLLAGSSDTQVRIHTLNGFDTICAKHRRFYEDAVKAIAQVDPGTNVAMGVAGSNLLKNAKSAGVDVSPEVMDRFTKAAGFLSILSGGKDSPSKKK